TCLFISLAPHPHLFFYNFFFPDPPPPEIYTLSLHDALPISSSGSTIQTRCAVNRPGSSRTPSSERTASAGRCSFNAVTSRSWACWSPAARSVAGSAKPRSARSASSRSPARSANQRASEASAVAAVTLPALRPASVLPASPPARVRVPLRRRAAPPGYAGSRRGVVEVLCRLQA